METVSTHGVMDLATQDSGKRIKFKDVDTIAGLTVGSTLVNGTKIICMG